MTEALTREQWLSAAVDYWRPLFAAAGKPLPSAIRVTMGFPSTGRASSQIGECWHGDAARDGAFNVYLKPTFDATDSARVLDVLVHELCHAALPFDAGHGVQFKALARAMGLDGPARATVAGPDLAPIIEEVLSAIGPLPHGALDASMSLRKKQGTRMRLVKCGACGYKARVTRQWLDAVGAPFCGNSAHGRMTLQDDTTEE